jgi:hypothetical protein
LLAKYKKQFLLLNDWTIPTQGNYFIFSLVW